MLPTGKRVVWINITFLIRPNVKMKSENFIKANIQWMQPVEFTFNFLNIFDISIQSVQDRHAKEIKSES